MEKVRKCLEKMSLKKTLVLLFVISLASVMILAIITIWIASDVRQELLDKRPIIVLDYSKHQVENDQDISGPEGFHVTVNDLSIWILGVEGSGCVLDRRSFDGGSANSVCGGSSGNHCQNLLQDKAAYAVSTFENGNRTYI